MITPADAKTLRERLREERARRRVTQMQLAAGSGVSQSNISAYLAGRRDVTTETYDRLWAALMAAPAPRQRG
jgi:transcriptional regulator with XRE-family HTH domain